jgi:hypothetical protein
MDRTIKEETDRLAQEFHLQWNLRLHHFNTIDMLSTRCLVSHRRHDRNDARTNNTNLSQ